MADIAQDCSHYGRSHPAVPGGQQYRNGDDGIRKLGPEPWIETNPDADGEGEEPQRE